MLRTKKKLAYTEACFVVQEGVREVKISVVFAVVELDSDSVMDILVNSPYESRQVKACVQSAYA
jgi:hypothetical protein